MWRPNVTVAAIIERHGQFLLVEEETSKGIRYSQPAGHVDQGESLIDAVIRETLEETAYHFVPQAILGIYQWIPDQLNKAYIRIAFIGQVTEKKANYVLDEGIIQAAWFEIADIYQLKAQHRSPQVLACIEDYLAGQRYPLSLLHYINEASDG